MTPPLFSPSTQSSEVILILNEFQSTAPKLDHTQFYDREKAFDFTFKSAAHLASLFVLILFLTIIASLAMGSFKAIYAFGFSFFINSEWNPVTQKFGAVVPIIGTLVTSILAVVIATPISVGIAIFITELAPTALKVALSTTIELLAAIPGIIYGMWGLFVFAPIFGTYVEPWINSHLGKIPVIGVLFTGPSMGIGILPAGIILSIMIIPFIASVTRDVFEVVPPLLKESAYGLGATTWEVLWQIVLPHTRSGVLGGVLLGLGRALGETMAVTFVIGNSHDLSSSLLMPSSTISSSLANEFTEAVGDLYTASLIELGLILFFITFVVLSIAKLMLFQVRKREGILT